MIQNRKEYRKSFNSPGQLYIAGDLLDIKSYNISVNGIQVEITTGTFLHELNDFKALLKENKIAEIYVKDLMLTGTAEIAWVKAENEKIMLGLEYQDIKYNADKLWRKRINYRSSKEFSGYFIADDKRIDFQGINISTNGLAIKISKADIALEADKIVKLKINDSDIKGLGKIVWLNNDDEETCSLGLLTLTVK